MLQQKDAPTIYIREYIKTDTSQKQAEIIIETFPFDGIKNHTFTEIDDYTILQCKQINNIHYKSRDDNLQYIELDTDSIFLRDIVAGISTVVELIPDKNVLYDYKTTTDMRKVWTQHIPHRTRKKLYK